MNIIIDTSVWSLALRRQRSSPSAETSELAELVREGRAAMLGAVRQELLSGVRADQQFETLRGHLRAFPDIPLEAEDYEEAASFFNKCRAKGDPGLQHGLPHLRRGRATRVRHPDDGYGLCALRAGAPDRTPHARARR
jgi:predicted nucleic acid-binding protein